MEDSLTSSPTLRIAKTLDVAANWGCRATHSTQQGVQVQDVPPKAAAPSKLQYVLQQREVTTTAIGTGRTAHKLYRK